MKRGITLALGEACKPPDRGANAIQGGGGIVI
jgi:hypothetical protein